MRQLLLPGTHQQALDWIAFVRPTYMPRVILREEQLCGINADSVSFIHQIGTYWENPAWGSDTYLWLMTEGVRLNQHWAMDWTLDWQKAMNHRDPVSDEKIQTIRRNLQKLEQELLDESPGG